VGTLSLGTGIHLGTGIIIRAMVVGLLSNVIPEFHGNGSMWFHCKVSTIEKVFYC
jgi:hypothetical protein